MPARTEAEFAHRYADLRRTRPIEQSQAWRAVATIKGLHWRWRYGAPLEWPLAAVHAVLTGAER